MCGFCAGWIDMFRGEIARQSDFTRVGRAEGFPASTDGRFTITYLVSHGKAPSQRSHLALIAVACALPTVCNLIPTETSQRFSIYPLQIWALRETIVITFSGMQLMT